MRVCIHVCVCICIPNAPTHTSIPHTHLCRNASDNFFARRPRRRSVDDSDGSDAQRNSVRHLLIQCAASVDADAFQCPPQSSSCSYRGPSIFVYSEASFLRMHLLSEIPPNAPSSQRKARSSHTHTHLRTHSHTQIEGHGEVLQPTTLTILGSNFHVTNPSPSVRVGMTLCSASEWLSDSSLLCALAAGFVYGIACLIHGFLDGYCSTVQGLLDWVEVDLGFYQAFCMVLRVLYTW